ncbi:MAG: hypothetical protein EOM55_03795 [Clostridia bacterium]|nr:hypothetical protein [Clostridia bacterium]
MINSKGILSVKMKIAVVFFAILSVFSLAIFSQTNVMNAYAFNEYGTACEALKNIEFYPYEESAKASVDAIMQNYIDERGDVLSEDLDLEAEEKYTTLLSQKTNLNAYFTVSNTICCIICYADNPTLATNAMTAYSSAKQNLVTSYGDTYIMLYVNSNSADAKYALLLSQKSSYVTYLYNPQPVRTTYIYYGDDHTFLPTGFDSSLMTITNNKQTNANEAGYDVVVSLKDKLNYRWNDGTVNDLHYKFIIQKLCFTESEINGILFNSRTFVFTNTSHSVEISSLPAGLSVDHLTVNCATRFGTSFSATNAGKYTVTAHLVADGNHVILKDNQRLSSMELTSTLVIKPVELSSNNVTVSTENGFETDIVLYILSSSATEKENMNELLAQKDLLSEDEGTISMYEAYLVKDGEEVQPESSVTIHLLIPEALRGVNFRILNIHNVSVNVTEISEVVFTTSGNFVTFQTDSLSSFAFLAQTSGSQSTFVSIVAIVIIVAILIFLIVVFVLYLLWKNYGNKKAKFLVPFFKKLNKLFHGTVLNDVELVQEGKKLLRKANERQKLEVEKMSKSAQEIKEKQNTETKVVALNNKNLKKDDKNAKNKK